MTTDTHYFVYVSIDSLRYTLSTNAGHLAMARILERRRKGQKREDGSPAFADVVICQVECPRSGGTAVRSGPLALHNLPGTLCPG